MHRVVQSHLETFADSFQIDLGVSKNFEAFTAYCVAKSYTFDSVDPLNLIYDGDEPGIDSVFFVCNEAVVTDINEIEAIFNNKKNNNEITCVFIQSKTSEGWSKKEINTFESAVVDFISEDPKHKYNEILSERRDIFSSIINNVGKIRNGRPSVATYFFTTAADSEDAEIIAANGVLGNRLMDSGLFSSVEVNLYGRDALLKLWLKSRGSYEATFSVIGAASFPKSAGIEESYVVTCYAKEFVSKVLSDDNGLLRRSIFDENVRDFINFDESPINAEIRQTIADADRSIRFGIMNNGLTIISPDVRLQSNEIFISNFQIVNGCQTSNVIFDALAELRDDTTLMAKIIETDNQDILDDIVRSTNRQNKVEDHQFLATLDSVKAVERYFAARGGDEEHRLFFERRPNQYSRDDIPSIRIFDLKELARATGAMFLDRPDLASRYPNQLVEDLHNSVFDPSNREEIFYASAYTLYRLKLHLSNKRIDPIFNKLKWYALMSLRYYLNGSNPAQPTARKVEEDCARIMDFVAKNDESSMKVWNEIATRLKGAGQIDRDRLRTTRFVAEVRELMRA